MVADGDLISHHGQNEDGSRSYPALDRARHRPARRTGATCSTRVEMSIVARSSLGGRQIHSAVRLLQDPPSPQPPYLRA